MKGWVLTKQGQAEAGIDLLRKGLAAWQATGVEVFSAYFLTLLAEAYRKVEQTESGLNVLAEAQAVVEKTGERVWEAEIHQLKGELLLVLGRDEAEADACFHKTLEVARRQQVKSGELRETMSLSRLWQGQGKKEEARELLLEIYG